MTSRLLLKELHNTLPNTPLQLPRTANHRKQFEWQRSRGAPFERPTDGGCLRFRNRTDDHAPDARDY